MNTKKKFFLALVLCLLFTGAVISISKLVQTFKYYKAVTAEEKDDAQSENTSVSDSEKQDDGNSSSAASGNETSDNKTEENTSEENTSGQNTSVENTSEDDPSSANETSGNTTDEKPQDEDPEKTGESSDGKDDNEPEDGRPKEPVFVKVDPSYFDDALFIGDSRSVGIREYSGLGNAYYFADTGMSIFNLHKKTVKVKDLGELSFEKTLKKRQFGKVYIMLGINELGSDPKAIADKYESTMHEIRENQPDAIMYVCATLGVTKEKSDKDKVFKNSRVRKLNEELKQVAERTGSYFIDVNPVYCDSDGNLSSEYARDFAHLYGKFYFMWADFYCANAILPEGAEHELQQPQQEGDEQAPDLTDEPGTENKPAD